MTIMEAIHRTDAVKPNGYKEIEKIKWLSSLDGLVKTHIIDTHEGGEDISFTEYDENTELSTRLLVHAPYDDIYIRWLEAQIDYANGEYDRYNNSMEMYNAAYSAFERYYNRTHMPLRRGRFSAMGCSSAVRNGKDGYTPIKGVDYWTDEDIAQMIASLSAAVDIDGKLDKSSMTGAERVYAITPDGKQQMKGMAVGYASRNTLVLRNGNGNAGIETPTESWHIANKSYVDNALKKVISSGISENSVRSSTSAAGIKGFYWYDIDYAANTVELTRIQGSRDEEFETGYQVGDVVTMENSVKITTHLYDRCAVITDISGNRITLDSVPIPIDDLKVPPSYDTDNGYLHNTRMFVAVERISDSGDIVIPNCGDIDFGDSAVALGIQTSAMLLGSHSEGLKTRAAGSYSHAEGEQGRALAINSHVEGYNGLARGASSHVEGSNSTADGHSSHAEGYGTVASGKCSHAEGYKTTASGECAHAEGYATSASGKYSHAEGYGTSASGEYSKAEGESTTAGGTRSHSEGWNTYAEGQGSHSEGNSVIARGIFSHAEGVGTTAHGDYSHAEGNSSRAEGNYSHAEGYKSQALGNYSHAAGANSIASADFQTVVGKNNAENADALFIVGNGKYSHSRSNAFEVLPDGIKIGSVTVTEAQLSALLALL